MGWFSRSDPSPSAAPHTAAPGEGLTCSFCRKSQREVRKLIAGPAVYICDECIVLCNEIVAEVAAPAPAPAPAKVPVREPVELLEALDQHAVGQRGAKRAIVAALRRHLAGSAQPGSDQRAPRLLLVGGTGTGKTSLGRAICAVTGLPAHHADVSRLSESGYVGEDVENLLRTLLLLADHQRDPAQRGVLFLDGLEKLAARHPLADTRDISGEGVQRELIRLLDGLDLAVPITMSRRHPQGDTEVLSCRHLFVAGAARLPELPPRASERELRRALEGAGLLAELVARFDRVVPLPRPDVDALVALLNHARGPIAEARRVVEALGGTLEYAPFACHAIAEAAAASAEGSWLLGQVVDRQMEEVLTATKPAKAWRVDEKQARALLAEALGTG